MALARGAQPATAPNFQSDPHTPQSHEERSSVPSGSEAECPTELEVTKKGPIREGQSNRRFDILIVVLV